MLDRSIAQQPRVPTKLAQIVTGNEFVAGGSKEVLEAQIQPLRNCSSYSTCELIVLYRNGEILKLFLKDFAKYKWSKRDMRGRAAREIAVYRDVLRNREVDTAQYYGSAPEGSEKLWLLLEYVEGSQLRACRGTKPWFATISWLVRMQSNFSEQSGNLTIAPDALIDHNAQFFVTAAERAVRNVGRVSTEQARRLDRVVERYPAIVSRMVALPKTLVHGSFRPFDILISGCPNRTRVCAVDWEQAAWGAPLYDLAYLIGEKSPRERDSLLEAYWRVARDFGLVGPIEDTKWFFESFRLHRLFVILRKAGRASFDASALPDLIETVGVIEQRLRLGAGR